jgi:hypothetical protein
MDEFIDFEMGQGLGDITVKVAPALDIDYVLNELLGKDPTFAHLVLLHPSDRSRGLSD